MGASALAARRVAPLAARPEPDGAVGRRGEFELGPVDLDLVPGERLSIVGPNGAGKSTLLGMLLGEVPLVAGERSMGRSTVIGAIGQDRAAFGGDVALVDELVARDGYPACRRAHAARKVRTRRRARLPGVLDLSPGERTRAHLAELQARGVNLLVLDEPTNHLDLEAVEQLENALADYDGGLVVVSHDRRFLERVAPTRSFELPL